MDNVTVDMETVFNSSNSTRNLNKDRKKSIVLDFQELTCVEN